MKLGLLVVLVVAVVLPSISESRTATRCELREKLVKAIRLPRRLERFREEVVAIVTCEVARRSHLDTNLVKVFGKRKPTTTVKPTIPTTAAGNETQSPDAATTVSKAKAPTTTTTTAAATTTTTTTPRAPTSQSVTTHSHSTAAGGRKKRAAPSSKKNLESDMSLEQMLNEEEAKFNEEEMAEDDDQPSSDENSSEEETTFQHMDVRRTRQSAHRRRPTKRISWSLGLYGLFQLTDSHFCNSGYRWSRNVCRTSCSAFADDDITDDVACFASSGYWRYILTVAYRRCYHTRRTYFNECK